MARWARGNFATNEVGTAAAVIIDCAYLVTLTAVIAREIVAGRNWRNLRVVVLVAVTALANIVFQAEVLIYSTPAYGLRLAIAAIVGLIMVVGGRITPSFTSNWLTRHRSEKRPAPLGRFDIYSIALATVALVAWIAAPDWYGTAALLLFMAIVQTARLSRWAGARTWREPILFVLHVGYGFVPLGALMLSFSILWPEVVPGKWRAACLDDRSNGDHDPCGYDAGDTWPYRSRCGFHADNNPDLWRYTGRYIGARRGTAFAHNLLPSATSRWHWLALGLRYFPPDLRADAAGNEADRLTPAPPLLA